MRDHAEVGDFDSPEAMLARKIDTSAKMIVRSAHAAVGVFSIAQSPKCPRLELQRTRPPRK